MRVPWTARRSNQSILKEISPGISLEGMMLKLKLQYFGYGKIEEGFGSAVEMHRKPRNDSADRAGDQPWDFFGRNDAEVEIPILW